MTAVIFTSHLEIQARTCCKVTPVIIHGVVFPEGWGEGCVEEDTRELTCASLNVKCKGLPIHVSRVILALAFR